MPRQWSARNVRNSPRGVSIKDLMRMFVLTLCLLACAVGADEAPRKRLLKFKIRAGARLTGSNTVSMDMTTSERTGDREKRSFEFIQRTEKFVDEVKEAGELGVIKIERAYLTRYEKVRSEKLGRPEVIQSPLSGQTVIISEKGRRREVRSKDSSIIDAVSRRTIGMELDWRDILSDDPVAPGDAWTADSTALARRLAAHFDCGTRTKMDVRYEADVEHEGVMCARFYIDWTLEGMRDRNLFTKVVLSGDVYFDHEQGRFVTIDLTGRLLVRGAVITSKGAPRIIKGEGQVSLKSTLKKSPPVQAAAE